MMSFLFSDRIVKFGGMQVNASFDVTSGVAPLKVFCDAVGTTDTSLQFPLHQALYIWEVEGVSWGNWSTTGHSKSIAYGPLACFVFPTAGTFTIKLTVFNGTAYKIHTQTITVTDPDVVFAGNNTVVVSTDGNFTGAPVGATTIQTSSFNGALASVIAANSNTLQGKRVLFRSGQSFTSTTTTTLDYNGPWTIGTFGGSTKTTVTLSAGTRVFNLGSASNGGGNGRIYGFSFNGGGSETSKGLALGGGFQNILVNNCDFTNMGTMISLADTSNGIPSGFCLADTVMRNIVGDGSSGNNCVYSLCEKFALLGFDIDNAGAGEHCVRLMYFNKAVVSHGIASSPNATKACMTLRGPAKTGIFTNLKSQHAVISFNTFIGNAGVTQVTDIGTVSPSGSQAECEQVLWDSNFYKNLTGAVLALAVYGSYSTIRNNIFDLSGGGATAINIDRDSGGSALNPNPRYNNVYNNTVYSNASVVNIWGVRLIDSEVENTDVRNNILYAPNVTGQARTVSDLGTNTIGASGTYGNSSQAQAEGVDPLFVNVAAGTRAGFALQAGSPYINNGNADTPVYVDAFMQKIGFGDSQRVIDSGAVNFS